MRGRGWEAAMRSSFFFNVSVACFIIVRNEQVAIATQLSLVLLL